ncbi:DUF1648 domain-containing protein [Anaerocolumna sp. MB42-C2]|uniref:DUF1648 domain-containing protein n=1 Tax=Anaerocolumna sp. MB42-C2 TaxID=3070997 RepID=UPI0027E139DE|nr:DUF1648 domain-containing protein [Anaerocolumna sp. MB42-C2]WMJ86018.1 DUF1648 domain-containing protein [Anaerocolumna sp. MB42-C2]
MKERIIIKRTKYDVIMNCLSYILLIGIVLYLFLNWSHIPDKIPGHYNALGMVDRWGNKNELWICPIIGVILVIGITLIEKFPQAWNVGIQVTEQNKERVYRLLKNMIVTEKGVIAAVFVFITVKSALAEPLPIWFLPVFLILLFGSIGISINKLMKLRP